MQEDNVSSAEECVRMRLPVAQMSELETVALQSNSVVFTVPGAHQTQLSLAHPRKCITYRKSLNAPLSSQTCLPLLEIK